MENLFLDELFSGGLRYNVLKSFIGIVSSEKR